MGGGPRAADIVLNETSFVPLLSGGGAEWRGKETTLLALHPGRNRLYSVALAADARYRVIHRDTVTNGVVASSTTSLSWDPVWEPYDLGVWANGDEVLVQWAEFMGGARTRGLALERIDLKTGFSRSVNPSVRFVAFGVDQARDSAWGIAEDQAREYFNVVSLDLASNVVSATEIPIAVPEAIL